MDGGGWSGGEGNGNSQHGNKITHEGERKMQQKLAGSIDFKKISVLGLGVFVVVLR